MIRTHLAVAVDVANPDGSCGAVCWLLLQSEERTRDDTNMGEEDFSAFRLRLRGGGGGRRHRRRSWMCVVHCGVLLPIISKESKKPK